MIADRRLKIDRIDRTGALFVTALLIGGFSYFVVVLSVHTYCENRPFAGTFAIAALVNGFFLLRNWPSSSPRRALSVSGMALCVLALAANIWFIIWATYTCRHMFDLLNK
jgi:hypothetical protein